MANHSFVHGCAPPLISEGNFPSNEGEMSGRLCANINQGLSTLSCCLPCPRTDWVYSDDFQNRTHIANYVAIISLILNTFLLVTFIVIPREKSHRHYLSIGLTASLILIAFAFIIPLGTKPDFCHDAITPNNLNTDASCGATGVLLVLGAMGAVVWTFLRSIWTALRVATDFKRAELFKKIAIALGVGLPIIFLAISLPITGVSYSLGNVCVPSNTTALPTWFAWILVFASASWIIQVFTILFCLWRFASFTFAGPSHGTGTSQSSIPTVASGASDPPQTPQKSMTPGRRKRIAWRKVKSIMILQWRSIVMAFIVANLTIYFGIVFIQHVAANEAQAHSPRITSTDLQWFACLTAHHGDKNKCLYGAPGLGLSESRAIGTLILASFVGIIVFLLMVRTSMFVGWWSLIRNPRNPFRRPSLENQHVLSDRRRSSGMEKVGESAVEKESAVPTAEAA